jgi:hypothetical protein
VKKTHTEVFNSLSTPSLYHLIDSPSAAAEWRSARSIVVTRHGDVLDRKLVVVFYRESPQHIAWLACYTVIQCGLRYHLLCILAKLCQSRSNLILLVEKFFSPFKGCVFGFLLRVVLPAKFDAVNC